MVQLPRFSVSGLPPDQVFKAVVFSTNGKGSSESFTLQVYTLKEDMAERRTGKYSVGGWVVLLLAFYLYVMHKLFLYKTVVIFYLLTCIYN